MGLFGRSKAKLDEFRVYWDAKQNAAKLTDPHARYYGNGGTLHGDTVLDVEVHNGQVVAVWFRCQQLPFAQHDVLDDEAAEALMASKSRLPMLTGVEVVDVT